MNEWTIDIHVTKNTNHGELLINWNWTWLSGCSPSSLTFHQCRHNVKMGFLLADAWKEIPLQKFKKNNSQLEVGKTRQGKARLGKTRLVSAGIKDCRLFHQLQVILRPLLHPAAILQLPLSYLVGWLSFSFPKFVSIRPKSWPWLAHSSP